jgi:hypothetical protein
MSYRVATLWRRANMVVRAPQRGILHGIFIPGSRIAGSAFSCATSDCSLGPEERWRFVRRPVVVGFSTRLGREEDEGRTRSLCEMARSVGSTVGMSI